MNVNEALPDASDRNEPWPKKRRQIENQSMQPGPRENTISPVSSHQYHEGRPERNTSMTPAVLSQNVDDEDAAIFKSAANESQDDEEAPEPITAKMAVSDIGHCYNMSHANRGKCVIFSHQVLDSEFSYKQNVACDDVARIKETFCKLRFDVDVYVDLNYADVIKNIHTLSSETDHSENDCICIFVLTYGYGMDSIMAKDRSYDPNMIWEPFTADKCPGLAGKPKLFFFQAPGIAKLVNDDSDAQDSISESRDAALFLPSHTIPAQSDFMIGHSCIDEFDSYRDSKRRASYITTLCEVLETCSQSTDLLKMFTMTAQRINDSDSQNGVKLPTITSTLTRRMYFGSATNEDHHQGASSGITAQVLSTKIAKRYNMSHPKRGRCVVFNQEKFDLPEWGERTGTDVDVKRIKATFENLGFTIDVCPNYDYIEVMNKITELNKEDHSESDCLCIFVLTHGWNGPGGDWLCAKDTLYKLTRIWKPFIADSCPTLKGKPKMFFIQACRGSRIATPVNVEACTSAGTEFTDAPMNSHEVPTDADFLIGHSCVNEFLSYRRHTEGSWFVQLLCSMLDIYSGSTDLLEMLTMTARTLAIDTLPTDQEKRKKWMKKNKQVSCITSTLTGDIYL